MAKKSAALVRVKERLARQSTWTTIATTAGSAATTTAKKGFWLDEFAFKLTLPSARTGFVFT